VPPPLVPAPGGSGGAAAPSLAGAVDRRWNDDDLNQLKSVAGTAFEAVDTGAIHH
jgi:hypothetical protein